MMQRLFTTEALAELLHVSTRTIMRERMAGRIGFKKIRGRIRFTQDDVDAYLEKQARLTSRGCGREVENDGNVRIFSARY
jgi:excisionase family DNA binding protein